jgi:alcohol dehydrogenase class IV
VLYVPSGRVDEISAQLLPRAGGRALVGLGGGRVIDTAKAIGGATGAPVTAVPTTLSGAEMTRFHRMPAGAENARLMRPSLVIADPDLMGSQPLPGIAASAMNALAHAVEALYTPLANPVASLAALRAAELLAGGIAGDPIDRSAISLGALLAGYASGQTGYAFHHVVCQTTVRIAGTPHAETNAVFLPHSIRMAAARVPEDIARVGEALGGSAADVAERLVRRTGVTTLRELGVGEEHVDPILDAVEGRREIANTPLPPDRDELRSLVVAALG